MGAASRIEWTEATWNPVTGCSKISAGCKFCYAEVMARRLQAMGQERYRDGFEIRLQEDLVDLPLRWVKPRTIFVNSMSDLFHVSIPESYIASVFDTMVRASWHTFQVLTKRSERLLELAPRLRWAPNIWVGVSVENQAQIVRISHLARVTQARVRFLSLEPLLERLPNLPLGAVSWVIVGGESGVHARPMDGAWVREIRDQCLEADVPFFFKQWGGRNKKATGRILDGQTWDQLPA